MTKAKRIKNINNQQNMNMHRHFLFSLVLSLSLSVSAENWMSRLPDQAYAAVVSIPGSHDSATGSGWATGSGSLGDEYARTQELTLAEQWTLGIRAFDFRPCVYKDYMNLNHGIMATRIHMEDALSLLRDSLAANPSEFVVIHMLHESDGDQVDNAYNERIQQLLRDEAYSGLFVDFRKELRVSDLRGKILVISRDSYATTPIGAFFQNWTGEANWNKQMQLRVVGPKSNSPAVVQDFSETWQSGAMQTKLDALTKLLDYSTQRKTTNASTIRWVFNFASAYSKVLSLFGFNISTSDGYRDNASHTNAAIIEYLQTHTPGPTGIVLMDYVGVQQTGSYATRGREVVEAIIQNNFGYLGLEDGIHNLPAAAPAAQPSTPALHTLSGQPVSHPRPGTVCILTRPDGTTRKVIIK